MGKSNRTPRQKEETVAARSALNAEEPQEAVAKSIGKHVKWTNSSVIGNVNSRWRSDLMLRGARLRFAQSDIA
jgi:hypothetical protein